MEVITTILDAEALKAAQTRFIRRLIYTVSAAVVGLLGGHTLFEMLSVPHMKELGGGLGKGAITDGKAHESLDGRFVGILQDAVAGSDRVGTNGLDGILGELSSDGVVPQEVLDRTWEFIAVACPAVGGLGTA